MRGIARGMLARQFSKLRVLGGTRSYQSLSVSCCCNQRSHALSIPFSSLMIVACSSLVAGVMLFTAALSNPPRTSNDSSA